MAEISFSQSTEAEALNYQLNFHTILRKYRDLIQMDEKKIWKEKEKEDLGSAKRTRQHKKQNLYA